MIRRFFDLSFQKKIPLWGAILIVVSTLSVSGLLMYRSYSDLESTLLAGASGLGATLAKTLVPALLHEDVWRGFEIVRAPFDRSAPQSPHPELALVVTLDLRVFVSSDPTRFPMLAQLASGPSHFARLAEAIASREIGPVSVLEPEDSPISSSPSQ